jgi:threonine dehydrogenase-like Zn-dependent dehydrogenase
MDRTRQSVAIFGVLREDVIFGARHWGGLVLLGYGSHNRPAAERALALVTKGHLALLPLVTHSLPFTRYQEGIELLRTRQAIKVCFLPWAGE